MTVQIGRLHSFAIGSETTAGTAGTIDAWIPVKSGNLKPVVEYDKDDSGFGRIEAMYDAHIAKLSSEFSAKFILRPTTLGWILWAATGTQPAAPTTVETGVYKHSFVVNNTNTHQSFTIIHDDANQEEQAVYSMVDSLTIIGEVGGYAEADLKMKGRSPATTSGNTPTYLTTGDDPMLISRASVKIAADVASLSGASKIPVQNFKLTIDKNLEQIFSTMSSTAEALEFATQHNKQFAIKGDFEIVYNDTTYRALALAGTKQAIEIQIEGKSLIGATKYANVTFQVASAVLEDWDRSDDKDGIVTQSFGFTGLYKLSESKMLTVDLTNTKATQYS